jgi:hypothetical protein
MCSEVGRYVEILDLHHVCRRLCGGGQSSSILTTCWIAYTALDSTVKEILIAIYTLQIYDILKYICRF